VARRSDGALVGWGQDNLGQCTAPVLSSSEIFVDMAGGHLETAALVGPAPSPPTVYCTAKPTSIGCQPRIKAIGIPSASFANGCTVFTRGVIGKQVGLYFHSTSGGQPQPFHGGYLCVQSPVRRHHPASTGVFASGCDGVLSEDLNAYIASGADPSLGAGATVWIQAWTRDPGDPFGDSLSDAVQLLINP
jgi:hypothetical protein